MLSSLLAGRLPEIRDEVYAWWASKQGEAVHEDALQLQRLDPLLQQVDVYQSAVEGAKAYVKREVDVLNAYCAHTAQHGSEKFVLPAAQEFAEFASQHACQLHAVYEEKL